MSSILDNTKLVKHVTWCPRGDRHIYQAGRRAEEMTVKFLLNLSAHQVGDYRILVNYNMPLRGPGAAGVLEIDVVLINKFGVFVIEVKDWKGRIDAYDDYWWQDDQRRRDNVFISVSNKARTLHSNLFKGNGSLPELSKTGVVGLIVLAQGKRHYHHHSQYSNKVVTDIGPGLIQLVSNPPGNRNDSPVLSDMDIACIKEALFSEHIEKQQVLVEDYRVGSERWSGDLFRSFEASSVYLKNQRVRIKVYQLHKLAADSDTTINHFRRSAEANAKLGFHPNILPTTHFFPDENRPDVFYEVTELIDGDRLDNLIIERKTPMNLAEQLNYLIPLCSALDHAHIRGVYHRNVCPETVYVTRNDTVKLGDFDFAKVSDMQTISVAGQILVENMFTAPEVLHDATKASPASDIYSLGGLWYMLASLPDYPVKIDSTKFNTLNLKGPALELLKKMLKKTPESRPQNVGKVLAQLKELQPAG